jgi:hypothetical protein
MITQQKADNVSDMMGHAGSACSRAQGFQYSFLLLLYNIPEQMPCRAVDFRCSASLLFACTLACTPPNPNLDPELSDCGNRHTNHPASKSYYVSPTSLAKIWKGACSSCMPCSLARANIACMPRAKCRRRGHLTWELPGTGNT